MECSSRTASQRRCGRRKRSSNEGKPTTQLSDRLVESAMPALHKEPNEGNLKALSYRIRTPSKACPACPSFGGCPQQGEHTPYWMHAGETPINVTFARGSQAFRWVWRESISVAAALLSFLTLFPVSFQSFSGSFAAPCPL